MTVKSTLKTLFIINPIAGVGKQKNIDIIIDQYLDKNKFIYDLKFTSYSGHATKLTEEALNNNYNIIVAVGGDGTVSECSKALIGTEICMAVIPCGSGNGFAYHIGIERDIKKALIQLNSNTIKHIDTCEVNNLPFVNVSGIGFDAHIAKIFATTVVRGFFSYIKICLRELSYEALEYEIEYNNIKRKIKAYAIVFANTSQYGNDARIAPNAKIDDGLIDFVIIKKFPSWQIPFFLYNVLKGKILQNKNVEIILSKDMKISSKEPFAHLDGEVKNFTNPINVKVSDKKLKILVPNE
ncbi:MAG: diacylglycerol/lipid kinase family protein [Flavobacteriales bacterium]